MGTPGAAPSLRIEPPVTHSEVDNDNPRVWCLLGRKAGDNTQVRALAARLGWSREEKHIAARRWELLPHLLFGATLAGIDRAASSDLAPPWPQLVITAGRRNEPVARWIQRRAGGRCRLVHIGRPWAHPERWDLVVTTPQYFLPQAPNIVHNRLPLHDTAVASPEDEARDWVERWNALPRPWIALLMGGDSGPFVFTAGKGRHLGELASRLAATAGGSLLFTDSARTPPAAATACTNALTAPAHIHRGCDAARTGGGNPYRAMLALADAFIVTGESMSMLAEAHARGRPLFVFDPADEGPWWRHRHAWRAKPLSHRLAMRFGPRRMRRDVGRIQHALIDGGEAAWLDERSAVTGLPAPRAHGADLSEVELQRAADAVRALWLRP